MPELKYGGNRAFFRPSADLVQMPKIEQFSYVQAYYTTFFHELIHSSGSKKRLDRVMGKSFGDKDYAFEELIAELGSAFICGTIGLESKPREDHAQYLASWLRELKNDNKFIIQAASKAQKAADYALIAAGLMEASVCMKSS